MKVIKRIRRDDNVFKSFEMPKDTDMPAINSAFWQYKQAKRGQIMVLEDYKPTFDLTQG